MTVDGHSIFTPEDRNQIVARPWRLSAAVSVLDALLAGVAFLLGAGLAGLFGAGAGNGAASGLGLATAVYVLACAIVFWAHGLYRIVWRFTAFNDVLAIGQAVGLAAVTYLVFSLFLPPGAAPPATALLLQGPLTLLLVAGPRVGRQISATGDWRPVGRGGDPNQPPALVLGTPAGLDRFLLVLKRGGARPPFQVRGLVSTDGRAFGRLLHGAPILGGGEELARALISLSAAHPDKPKLVVVPDGMTRAELARAIDAASVVGAEVLGLDVVGDRAAVHELAAPDLIGRQPRTLDKAAVRRLVAGKTVLVTGAGGTIGGELSRQLTKLDPAKLVLVDSSEYNLYQIDLEIKEIKPSFEIRRYLGDVRDELRVAKIFEAERPAVVLHAAALKHVPLMEENPAEAVLTNLGGTVCVLDAARRAGTETFVLISTDKAVHPTNVMGASKRAAELYVQAVDALGDDLHAVSVRFGNVLGSTGSVAPLFERQIRAGGPVTVTHKDMERYFMTVEEAASLVLQAASLAAGAQAAPAASSLNGAGGLVGAHPTTDPAPRGGAVFVLDMGVPVKIDELARQLCRLRGKIPGVDIEIVYTGLRPGEKVREDLFYDDTAVSRTAVDGVMVAHEDMLPYADARALIEDCLAVAARRDRSALYAALTRLAPEFQGNGVDAPAAVVADAPLPSTAAK